MIQGLDQLQRKIKDLPARVQRKAARKALGRGATVLVKAIRADAPKGKTGEIKKEIGKRLKTVGGNVVVKIGAGLGSRRKGAIAAGKPHAHLLILGTKPRFTGARTRKTKHGSITKATGNKKAFRGQVEPIPFVRDAVNQSQSVCWKAVKDSLLVEIAKEAAK